MKKIFTAFLTLIMLVVCCFSLTACKKKDFVEVEFEFTVGSETVTVNYTLYGHLALESVKQFKELVNKDYYDGAVMYSSSVLSTGARLLGKYKFDANGNLAMNEEVDAIKGEFAKGGTLGSDLKANKGNLCVFRWWDTEAGFDNSGFNTGSLGNIIIPTNGAFEDVQNNSTTVAVFGVIDEGSVKSLDKIISGNENAWKSENKDTFHVFYYEENGALKRVILNHDDYQAKVKDGIYKIDETKDAAGNVIETETVEIFDPREYEGSNEGWTSAKYQEDTVEVPKSAYRITLKNITIKK